MSETAVAETNQRYVLVDSIPEVAEIRQERRGYALEVIASRHAALAEGGAAAAELPLPVDALSTAKVVIRLRDTLGSESEVAQERVKGLRQDCTRLVTEAWRVFSPECFQPLRQYRVEGTQDFYSHGYSANQMVDGGLAPIIGNPEEEGRRVNEYVENYTPQAVREVVAKDAGRLAVRQALRLRTISQCTKWALEQHQKDVDAGEPSGGYMGYVPQIAKYVLRDFYYVEGTNDRFQEQLSASGKYITHEVFQIALKRREANVDHMDETQLHGAQILVDDDIWAFQALLDEVASELWCTHVFMGEEVTADHPKDYAAFRREALVRQEKLQDFADTLTVFVLDLAEDGVENETALHMIREFVKQEMLDVAKAHVAENDLGSAGHMFEKHTVEGLQRVVAHEAAGNFEAARAEMSEVERMASIGFCGADGCGIERADLNTAEGREVAEKLGASSTDKIVKDKVRSCKGCGTKGVWYAYSKSYVKKHCSTCGLTENKVSKVS